jgi:hypothetical protein
MLGWSLGRRGQSLTAILPACLEAASGTAEPDAVALYMVVATVQELQNRAALDVTSDSSIMPSDLTQLEGVALEIQSAFRCSSISEADRTQINHVNNALCPAGRRQPTAHPQLPTPQYFGSPPSTLPTPFGPTPALAPPASPAGGQPGAPAAPSGNWCWDFNRPSGCKRPPGTCKKDHVIMPCPRMPGCPLSARECHYKH